MDSKMILNFLREVMMNNNRPWFQEHKGEYMEARSEFESGVAKAIARISEFDESIAQVTVKDSTYRFYQVTHGFHQTNLLIRTILAPISMRMARRHCEVVIIFI